MVKKILLQKWIDLDELNPMVPVSQIVRRRNDFYFAPDESGAPHGLHLIRGFSYAREIDLSSHSQILERHEAARLACPSPTSEDLPSWCVHLIPVMSIAEPVIRNSAPPARVRTLLGGRYSAGKGAIGGAHAASGELVPKGPAASTALPADLVAAACARSRRRRHSMSSSRRGRRSFEGRPG